MQRQPVPAALSLVHPAPGRYSPEVSGAPALPAHCSPMAHAPEGVSRVLSKSCRRGLGSLSWAAAPPRTPMPSAIPLPAPLPLPPHTLPHCTLWVSLPLMFSLHLSALATPRCSQPCWTVLASSGPCDGNGWVLHWAFQGAQVPGGVQPPLPPRPYGGTAPSP